MGEREMLIPTIKTEKKQLESLGQELIEHKVFVEYLTGVYSDKQSIQQAFSSFAWIEIYLMVCYMCQVEDLPMSYLNLLFEQKHWPLLKNPLSVEAKRYLNMVTLRRKPTGSPDIWGMQVEQYLACPSAYRLFQENAEGHLELNPHIQISVEREEIYLSILNNLQVKISQPLPTLELKEEVKSFAYLSYHENDRGLTELRSNSIQKSAAVVDSIESFQSEWILPPYQKKVRAKIPQNLNMRDILDSISKTPSSLPLIRLNFANPEEKEIIVKEIVHILGGLGVGKSNFKYAMTKYFLEKQGLRRIAIIEDKVSTVLDVVQQLNEKGVYAVPVIGKEDEEHLADYLSKLTPEQFDKNAVLEWLSGTCTAMSVRGDFQSSTDKAPCGVMYQGESSKKINCPFIGTCGKMKRYRDLSQAQVWVGTVSALATANIPPAFNPNKRTFFELVYDLCDLVFFDEVDGTQELLDDSLIKHTELINGFKLNKELSTLQSRMYEEGAFTVLKSQLRIYLGELQLAKDHLNELLKICLNLTQQIEGKVFSANKLLSLILNCIDTEKTKPSQLLAFKYGLKEFISVANIFRMTPSREHKVDETLAKNPIYQAYKKMSREYEKSTTGDKYKQYRLLLQAAQDYTDLYQIQLKDSSHSMIYELMMFLVVITEIDRYYKLIVTRCENLRMEHDSTVRELYNLSLSNLPSSQFALEPLIEVRYGYQVERDGNQNDKFRLKLHQYSGVGRSLLTNLTNIKVPLGEDGPGIIALSGTSCFPGSPHFHFDVPASILMESIDEAGEVRKEGDITMQTLFIPDEESGTVSYLSVSGISNPLQRQGNLSKILTYLDERLYLKKAINYKRVLVVVGNYDEAAFVNQELIRLGYKSIALGKKEDDYTITRARVESLALEEHRDKECFVVSIKSIARGYNILDEDYNSWFGTAFFLTRPYPQPESFNDSLKITHSQYQKAIEEIMSGEKMIEVENELGLKEQIPLGEVSTLVRFQEFYGSCMKYYQEAYNMGTWKTLNEKQRIMVSAYALVIIKQMIGRMQRNRNACFVYFCDGSFCNHSQRKRLNKEKGDSMFDYWNRSLTHIIETEPFGASLFGEFHRALGEMMKNASFNQ